MPAARPRDASRLNATLISSIIQIPTLDICFEQEAEVRVLIGLDIDIGPMLTLLRVGHSRFFHHSLEALIQRH